MYFGFMLSALLATAGPPSAAPDDPPKLVLYAQTSLAGDSRSIVAAFPNLEAIDFDNKARSVRVIAGTWEICEEKHFKKCQVVEANVLDLEATGLSRKISSVRLRRTVGSLVSAAGVATVSAQVPAAAPGGRIVFYDKTNFRGGTLALDEARGNLAGLTARVESLRIESGTWQLCTGMNYTGTCTTMDADSADLGSWRNKIVSARPVAAGRAVPAQ